MTVGGQKIGREKATLIVKDLQKQKFLEEPNFRGEAKLSPTRNDAPVKADVTPTTKQDTQEATPTPGAAEATSPSVKQTTQKAKPTPGTAKSKPEGKPVATKTTPKTNADLVVEAVAEYRKIKSPTGDQAVAFVSRLTDLGIANPPAFLARYQHTPHTSRSVTRGYLRNCG
jgi:hypothetical protein